MRTVNASILKIERPRPAGPLDVNRYERAAGPPGCFSRSREHMRIDRERAAEKSGFVMAATHFR